MNPDRPECLSCGTCCFSTLERYVPVSGDDYARLAGDAERLVLWVENRAYLRIEEGHCAALAIDPTTARFVCTVYASGGPRCVAASSEAPRSVRGESSAKRDRPLLALGKRRLGARMRQIPPVEGGLALAKRERKVRGV